MLNHKQFPVYIIIQVQLYSDWRDGVIYTDILDHCFKLNVFFNLGLMYFILRAIFWMFN